MSEFPQSLTKRLRVPPLPTRRVVVEALGQTPTDSYTVLMDQRRLHLHAEVCFSSPLAPCSLPSFSHGVTVAVWACWPQSSTSHAGSTPFFYVARPPQILPRRPDFLATGECLGLRLRIRRSGRLKSRREGPSLMFEDDGTLSNQLLPPIPDSTSQNKSNSSADAWLRERP